MSEDMAHFLGWWPRCHPGTEAPWGALSKARRGHGATLTLRGVFSVVSHTGVGQPWLPDTSSEPSGTSGKELVCRTVISPGEGLIISSTKTFNFHRHLLFALIVSIGHNVALASNFGLFTLFRS